MFEWVTGGGALGGPIPEGSLWTEGLAMRQALVADLLQVPGCHVRTLLDARGLQPDPCSLVPAPSPHSPDVLSQAACQGTPSVRDQASEPCPSNGPCTSNGPVEVPVATLAELGQAFDELVQESDAVWIIAPEIGDELRRWVVRAERLNAKLLGPGTSFIARAGDKYQLSRHLTAAGVPAIPGELWRADQPWPDGIPFPAVVKPRQGAGCWGVRRCDSLASAHAALAAADPVEADPDGYWLVQPFLQGVAASVSAVGDGAGHYRLLPACRQRLNWTRQHHWIESSYHGSELLALPELSRRAHELAQAALGTLPSARGYVGLDLLLDVQTGQPTPGMSDYVVEVNARLTTSYLLLRREVPGLARSIVDTSRGMVQYGVDR